MRNGIEVAPQSPFAYVCLFPSKVAPKKVAALYWKSSRMVRAPFYSVEQRLKPGRLRRTAAAQRLRAGRRRRVAVKWKLRLLEADPVGHSGCG